MFNGIADNLSAFEIAKFRATFPISADFWYLIPYMALCATPRPTIAKIAMATMTSIKLLPRLICSRLESTILRVIVVHR